MALQALLGDFPAERFVAEFLHRLPFSLPEAASEFRSLGTWKVFGDVVSDESSDIMVVRDGRRSDCDDPRTEDAARRLCDAGHTILVRHAEKHHAGLRDLAQSFERDLHAPVNIHMYATPANAHGFSWHYDAEDVFIIQTAGVKEYSLRKNTVNPWPLVETIPADMRYERELMPVSQVELHAGDWLYIPCGYWHKAEAKGTTEAAISLAVGVMSHSAVAVFDFLRKRLLDSLLWRQRLPIAGELSPLSEEELLAQYRELFDQLADDLSGTLRSEPFARAFREHISEEYGE